MDEHIEHVKKIKKLLGDYLKECAEDKKIDAGNVTYVKEALSAFQKACWIIEDLEGEGSGNYGANRSGMTGNYGRRRRDSIGRYMDGGYYRGGHSWMPGPYYDGGQEDLADELEQMAKDGGSEAKATALREAARWLRQG